MPFKIIIEVIPKIGESVKKSGTSLRKLCEAGLKIFQDNQIKLPRKISSLRLQIM
jgi:hypothetical protein